MGKSIQDLTGREKGGGHTPACNFLALLWKGIVFMYLKSLIFVVAFSIMALAACYESPDITFHEPAEYKGSGDPLLEKQASSEQQEALRKRFLQVQTDR
jgi:hypothetical protein